MIEEIVFDNITVSNQFYGMFQNYAYLNFTAKGFSMYIFLLEDDDGSWYPEYINHYDMKGNHTCPFCLKKPKDFQNSCPKAEKYKRKIVQKIINDPTIRLRLLMDRMTITLRN